MKKVLTSINDEQIIGAIQANHIEIQLYDSNFDKTNVEIYNYDLVVMTEDDYKNKLISSVKAERYYILGLYHSTNRKENIFFFQTEDALRKALFIWPHTPKIENEITEIKNASSFIEEYKPEIPVEEPALDLEETELSREDQVKQNEDSLQKELDESNIAPPLIIEDDYPSTEFPIDMGFLSTAKIEAMRKQYVFKGKQYPNNKTIAVWSPLPRIGVSSFLLNFAIYLQERKIQTAVIEAMQPAKLARVLSRYEPKPDSFRSFIEVFHLEEEELAHLDYQKTNWQYKGVLWLPVGENDEQYSWSKDFIEIYFQFFRYHDVILTDLPYGEMNEETKEILRNIDELWVMVDNSIIDILMWKDYIHHLKNEYQLSMKLLFNRTLSISKVDSIVNSMELPLIGTIPDLTEEYTKFQYKKKPLIAFNDINEKIQRDYDLLIKQGLQLDTNFPESFLLKTFFKKLFPLKG